MIVFPMIVLIVVPLVAGIESLFTKKEKVWGLSILAGFSAGAFLWNAYTYWIMFPVVSIVLIALAAALILRLVFAGTGILTKGLIAAIVTIAVLFLAWQGLFVSLVNAEVISDVEVLNPDGSAGTALVVYHPGKSSFQERINHAFAEGLVSNGWRVEVTTASSQAPADLSDYDLLVLGAPTYEWRPAQRTQHHLKRLGDLGCQPTVAVITGAGATDLSIATMEDLIREANGDLVKSLVLWTAAPNEETYGISDPVEIMLREAQAIPLPGQ